MQQMRRVQLLREKKILIKWQKLTKHLLTTDGKEDNMPRSHSLDKVRNMELRLILMLVKLLLLRESYFIQELVIKLVKCMMVRPLWIGWSKSKREVLQLLVLLLPVNGRDTRLIYRHSRSR